MTRKSRQEIALSLPLDTEPPVKKVLAPKTAGGTRTEGPGRTVAHRLLLLGGEVGSLMQGDVFVGLGKAVLRSEAVGEAASLVRAVT